MFSENDSLMIFANFQGEFRRNKMDMTLIVMAAGMGSRFGGLKQVEPIGPNGEAILDFSVYDAKRAGFSKVVFVIKHAIEKEFKELVGKRLQGKINVEYVFQETDRLPEGLSCPDGRTKPWGTGHAVLCCKDVVKTPFAVINSDDFYGKEAFLQIADGIKNGDYCMAGFRLGNTVTENGYVSRGVCETENGLLKSITEYKKIDPDCVCDVNGVKKQLSPDTVVSMNFWGFTPDIFEYIEEDFIEFFKNNSQDPTAEFYLPSVVDKLIKTDKKTVSVKIAESKWYGVTYKEDKAGVVDAVKKLISDGEYPNL